MINSVPCILLLDPKGGQSASLYYFRSEYCQFLCQNVAQTIKSLHISSKKFGHVKKKQYLCTRFRKEGSFPLNGDPDTTCCGGESGGLEDLNESGA